jgi:hypothetical protein
MKTDLNPYDAVHGRGAGCGKRIAILRAGPGGGFRAEVPGEIQSREVIDHMIANQTNGRRTPNTRSRSSRTASI